MARSALLNVMVQAAMKAGRQLSRDFGEVQNLQVSVKGPGDFVSQADIKAEKTIQEELLIARPDYGFLMEEGGEIKGKDQQNRCVWNKTFETMKIWTHIWKKWNNEIRLKI